MNTIIICPDDFKKKRLNELYKENKINEDFYITLEQLKERLFFKIETEAKLFTRDYLNVKYSVACSLLSNIYYVDNEVAHENLDRLRKLKNELIKNNLLTFDNLFPFYLKRHNVVVMGYLLSNNDMLLINEVKKYTNVEIINISYEPKKLDVIKYHSIEEEVDNTFKKIISLVEKGVSLNDIKLTNIDSSYIHLLRRYSLFYNIKINFKKNDSILSSSIVNHFLNLYNENKNVIEVIDLLKEKYSNNDIVKKIVNLINNQTNVNTDLTDVFLYEFEKMKFDELRYDNALEIVDFYNYEFKDNYVFVLNLNNKTLPKEFKDDQYLSDNITSQLNLDTTLSKIKLDLECIKIKLFNIENIFISFKESTKSKEVMPSRLIQILDMNVITYENKNEYSNLNAKLKASCSLEEFIKYDVFDDYLNNYYHLIENDFKSYNNKYTKVDLSLIKEKLDNKIKLSYTSLSTYYKCSFAFYLERVLKIKVDNTNFANITGTVFHEILENINNEGYDYLEEINNNRSKYTTNQELFFYDKLSKEFIDTLPIIKHMNSLTFLTNEKPEEKVEYETEKVFKREFVGLVDKVIYKEVNDKTYLAVIDYKTGNVYSTLDNVVDGFNLQLPIYAYMLKKSTSFKNPIVLGMFLQQILNSPPKYDSKKSVEEQLKEGLKLKGYIVGEDHLDLLDPTYQNSEMISGLKTNAAGTELSRYSKVMTTDEFDELADLVENLIENAFDNIEQLKFDINPKVIGNDNKSCTYCKYESICFLKHQDKVKLDKNNFLKKGDDSNGMD
ncbi:MAG: PD-(D/E)XK nuclease family protein [bacterium]